MRVFDKNCMNLAYGSSQFFGQALMPKLKKVGRRQLGTATPYVQREQLEYIYVNGGQGNIDVNGRLIPLQRGSCMVLANFQLTRFLPTEGKQLDLHYCQIGDGSVYVFWSCPYYQPPDFQTSVMKTMQVQQFADDQLEEIEMLWQGIYNCHFSTEPYAKQQQLYLFMEYLGWFHRLCFKDDV